jgi:hypothetical protein
MAQEDVLKQALITLIDGYRNKIDGFSALDFLKTGVDPFRFTVNVSIWGLKEAVRKEIEHKVEMTLENLVGDFHENYLGNATHNPSNSKWEKIIEGSIPGIDIVNKSEKMYLQIKSKHNSMNSSSAKRLAQELEETSSMFPDAFVGCIWIVAMQNRKAIGENNIAEVAACYKGNKSYELVTGEEGELDAVLLSAVALIPEIVNSLDLGSYESETGEVIKRNFEKMLDEAAQRVCLSLQAMAKESNQTAINIVTSKSIN